MTWRASFRIRTSTSNASRFRRMTEEGLTHPVIARLADELTARAATCREILRHVSSCQHVLRIAFSLAHRADWASHIPQPLLMICLDTTASFFTPLLPARTSLWRFSVHLSGASKCLC